MAKDEVKLSNGFKLAVDWNKLAEEYKELMPSIDINQIATGSYCGASYAYDLDSANIQADRSIYDDGICSVPNNAIEFEEIKHRLEKLEEANDSMRTDNKAMVDGIILRENRIKELDAENSKLKAKIEELVEAIDYCKRNGIWAECTSPSPSIEDKEEEKLHLLDGLELD